MKTLLSILIVLCFLVVVPTVTADDIGRYQIISFGNNFTFLLDTVTGQAWMLAFQEIESTKTNIATPPGFKILGNSDTLRRKDMTKGFWIAIKPIKKGG